MPGALWRGLESGVGGRSSGRSAKLSKARANALRIELRLLPRREVPAFGIFVVISELGIRFLSPTARGGIDFVGEGAYGHRDGGDALDVEKALLRRGAVVPIGTRRRYRRVRQPIKRDVVEDLATRQFARGARRPIQSRDDRRCRLADWLTAKDNPFFARNFVNRVWSYVMGRGLVEPVDDMRATNPPTNPELLDALAADFVDHHFDLRHLLSTIMKSRAYQLSSHIAPENSADALDVYFTRFTVRRLTAEQLADALDLVTLTHEKYQGLPSGTRASQLPDPLVRSFLLDVFGRPPRQVACECERGSQPNIAQALHLLNGTFLNQKIGAPGGRLDGLLRAGKPAHAIVEELYLVALSRPPTSRELAKAQTWVAQAPSPRDGMQDLFWTLLNSREFLFIH